MYHKVPLTLTESQFKKMRAGHPIQLAHHQIGHGMHRHHLMLHPENAKKVAGAIRKQKGCRIHVSPHEFEASGEGIMDFFNKIKDAGNWLKSKVIDTPFYQQNVKPLVRQAVDTGLAAIAPRLGSASNLATQGVHALGEKTGAFGIHAPRKHGIKPKGGKITAADHAAIRHYAFTPVMPARYNPGYELEANYAPMMGPQHPAMWPTMPSLPDIGGAVKRGQHSYMPMPVHHKKIKRGRKGGFGGSFRPA